MVVNYLFALYFLRLGPFYGNAPVIPVNATNHGRMYSSYVKAFKLVKSQRRGKATTKQQSTKQNCVWDEEEEEGAVE